MLKQLLQLSFNKIKKRCFTFPPTDVWALKKRVLQIEECEMIHFKDNCNKAKQFNGLKCRWDHYELECEEVTEFERCNFIYHTSLINLRPPPPTHTLNYVATKVFFHFDRGSGGDLTLFFSTFSEMLFGT